MTSGSIPGVIFVLQADSSNGYCPEIYLITHAFHTIVADLVRIKVAAITFAAAIANLAILQYTELFQRHFPHLVYYYSM